MLKIFMGVRRATLGCTRCRRRKEWLLLAQLSYIHYVFSVRVPNTLRPKYLELFSRASFFMVGKCHPFRFWSANVAHPCPLPSQFFDSLSANGRSNIGLQIHNPTITNS